MKAEIIREEPSGLARQVWRLSFHTEWNGPSVARVQQHLRQQRATRRHAWQTIGGWGYIDKYDGRTRKDAFPLPDGVVIEATEAFIAELRQAMGTAVSLHNNAASAKERTKEV